MRPVKRRRLERSDMIELSLPAAFRDVSDRGVFVDVPSVGFKSRGGGGGEEQEELRFRSVVCCM
jgi:hypothetical protein